MNEMDRTLDRKCSKACEKISHTIHTVLNEPSVGLYHIQNHCKRTAPSLVEQRLAADQTEAVLRGALYDVEYATEAVHALNSTQEAFKALHDSLRRCNSLVSSQHHTPAAV